ncbi:hypothetical protein PoB_000472200 [Plakobranchus ocellatus]|uniref:Uncharacterized protein n=1 Tax=Plakobranchus ocellatus TaxID=259542 RepID=A0AAV3Y7X8_9GAST|nr:hypothetical protein PoB_000472200 [Plakobranchus ocellatus]
MRKRVSNEVRKSRVNWSWRNYFKADPVVFAKWDRRLGQVTQTAQFCGRKRSFALLADAVRSKVCGDKLTGQLQGSIKEIFLAAKQFEDLQGPGLVILNRGLQSVVEALEIIYKQSAEDLLIGQKVKSNLATLLEKEATAFFKL